MNKAYVLYFKENVSELKFVSREYDFSGVKIAIQKYCFDNSITPNKEVNLSLAKEGIWTYFGGNFANFLVFEEELSDEEQGYLAEIGSFEFEK